MNGGSCLISLKSFWNDGVISKVIAAFICYFIPQLINPDEFEQLNKFILFLREYRALAIITVLCIWIYRLSRKLRKEKDVLEQEKYKLQEEKVILQQEIKKLQEFANNQLGGKSNDNNFMKEEIIKNEISKLTASHDLKISKLMDTLLKTQILACEGHSWQREDNQQKAKAIEKHIDKEKELFDAKCRALSNI
jgi:hypothetical protein